MNKKILSALLAVLLIAVMLPMQIFADLSVDQLYVGRPYLNEKLDEVNGAQGYKYDKSQLPPGLSLSGSYKYNGNLKTDVFSLKMEGTPTKAGTYTFSVTYKKADGTTVATNTYTATVGETAPFSYVDPNSISIAKWPNKYKGYYLGETIDFTGLKVTATVYKKTNGSKYTEITGYDITSCCYFDRTILTSDEAQSVKVYCALPTVSGGKVLSELPETILCGEFRIEEFKYADPNDITSMKVKTAPEKMEYLVGESFDPTGMVLEITYGSGATKEITTDYTVDVTELTEEGEKTVNITYEEVAATLVLNVKAPEESSSSQSESSSQAPVVSETPVVEEPVVEEPVVEEPVVEEPVIEEPIIEEPVVEEPVPEEPVTEEPVTEEKSSVPVWVWIVIVLAVLVLIGCAILFIVGKKRIEEDDDDI